MARLHAKARAYEPKSLMECGACFALTVTGLLGVAVGMQLIFRLF